MKPESAASSFDPFAAPNLSHTSKAWLWATGFQGVFTAGLLALSYYAEGHRWEFQARVILIIGVIATWSLALRAIRERIFELMRYWHKASKGLLKRASESGKHLISSPLSPSQEKYIKGAIWRLRIIAAGITIPFFVMPMVWCLIALVFSWNIAPGSMRDFWAAVSLFTMLAALIVAGYFHWVILPLPVRVTAQTRRYFPAARRK
ncbi:MAG TPA: hypothetical protein VEJ63_15095 [Planctomycetota bacterium]|nr:hypothetical protein [Planctomycetota bacterium]